MANVMNPVDVIANTACPYVDRAVAEEIVATLERSGFRIIKWPMGASMFEAAYGPANETAR